MATYLKDKSNAFKKSGDHTDLPTKQRSEARMKAYGSATDARAWVNSIPENKQYIIDLIGTEFPKNHQLGKYVPIDVLIKTLLSNKDADIKRLNRMVYDLEVFISQLDLNCEERSKFKNMKDSWGAGDGKPQLKQQLPDSRRHRTSSETRLSKDLLFVDASRTSSESRICTPRICPQCMDQPQKRPRTCRSTNNSMLRETPSAHKNIQTAPPATRDSQTQISRPAVSDKNSQTQIDSSKPGVNKSVSASRIPVACKKTQPEDDPNYPHVDIPLAKCGDCETNKKIARQAIEKLEILKKHLLLEKPEKENNEEKDCDNEIAEIAKEVEQLRADGNEDQLKVATTELKLLKKYCQKLMYIRDENKKLKEEMEKFKEQKPGPSGIENLGVHHSSVSISGTDPTELEKRLQAKILALRDMTKQRDKLQNSVSKLEQKLRKYDNLNNEIKDFKEKSKVLECVMQEKLSLEQRLSQLSQLENKMIALKQRADKTDELQRALENAQNKLLEMTKDPDRGKKGKGDDPNIAELKIKAKEADVLRVERDRLRIRLDELQHMEQEFIKLQQKCRCLEGIRAERDMYKTKNSELQNMQKKHESLQNQAEQVASLAEERESMIKKITDYECVIADQENEISRMVLHIDRLSKGQDVNQDKAKQIITDLRSEIEKKSSVIVTSEAHLETVQSQLKETIDKLGSETTNLKQQVVKSNSQTNELKKQIADLSQEVEDLKKALEEEKAHSCSCKGEIKELMIENTRLKELADQMNELTDAAKLDSILKKSHEALQTAAEKLSNMTSPKQSSTTAATNTKPRTSKKDSPIPKVSSTSQTDAGPSKSVKLMSERGSSYCKIECPTCMKQADKAGQAVPEDTSEEPPPEVEVALVERKPSEEKPEEPQEPGTSGITHEESEEPEKTDKPEKAEEPIEEQPKEVPVTIEEPPQIQPRQESYTQAVEEPPPQPADMPQPVSMPEVRSKPIRPRKADDVCMDSVATQKKFQDLLRKRKVNLDDITCVCRGVQTETCECQDTGTCWIPQSTQPVSMPEMRSKPVRPRKADDVCMDSAATGKKFQDLLRKGKVNLDDITCVCRGVQTETCECQDAGTATDKPPCNVVEELSKYGPDFTDALVKQESKISQLQEQHATVVKENEALKKHASELKDVAKSQISVLSEELRKSREWAKTDDSKLQKLQDETTVVKDVGPAVIVTEGKPSRADKEPEQQITKPVEMGSVGGPKDVGPKESPPKVIAPKDSGPKVIAPKDSAPKVIAPKDSAPKVIAPKDSGPKVIAPKDSAPKVIAAKQSPPKVIPPKESPPKVIPPKDEPTVAETDRTKPPPPPEKKIEDQMQYKPPKDEPVRDTDIQKQNEFLGEQLQKCTDELDELRKQLAKCREDLNEQKAVAEKQKSGPITETIKKADPTDNLEDELRKLREQLAAANKRLEDCNTMLENERAKFQEEKKKLEDQLGKKDAGPVAAAPKGTDDSDELRKLLAKCQEELAKEKGRAEDALRKAEEAARKAEDALKNAVGPATTAPGPNNNELDELRKLLANCREELAKEKMRSEDALRKAEDAAKRAEDALKKAAATPPPAGPAAAAPKNTDELDELRKLLANCRDELANERIKSAEALKKADEAAKKAEDALKKAVAPPPAGPAAAAPKTTDDSDELRKLLANCRDELAKEKAKVADALKKAEDASKRADDALKNAVGPVTAAPTTAVTKGGDDSDELRKMLAKCQEELAKEKVKSADALKKAEDALKKAAAPPAVGPTVAGPAAAAPKGTDDSDELRKLLANCRDELAKEKAKVADALKKAEDASKRADDAMKKAAGPAVTGPTTGGTKGSDDSDELRKMLAKCQEELAKEKVKSADALKKLDEALKKPTGPVGPVGPSTAVAKGPDDLDELRKMLAKCQEEFAKEKVKSADALKKLDEALKKPTGPVGPAGPSAAVAKGTDDLDELRKMLAKCQEELAKEKVKSADALKKLEEALKKPATSAAVGPTVTGPATQVAKGTDDLDELRKMLAKCQEELAKEKIKSAEALKKANAVGPTVAGPPAVGPTAVGPTAAGPTAVGPTAASPTAVDETKVPGINYDDLLAQLEAEKLKNQKLENALKSGDSSGLLDDCRKRLAELEGQLKACLEKNGNLAKLSEENMSKLKNAEKSLSKTKRQSMQAIQDARKSYERDLHELQDKYTEGIEKLQASHEELVTQTHKDLEAEVESLRQDSMEKQKTIDDLRCLCYGAKKPKFKLPKAKPLTQVQVPPMNIEPKVVMGDMLFVHYLKKMLYCGLESLTFDELQHMHTKICEATAKVMGKKGDYSPCRCDGDSDMKQRQTKAQTQVAKLQMEVALERQRLESLKKALEIERATQQSMALYYEKQAKQHYAPKCCPPIQTHRTQSNNKFDNCLPECIRSSSAVELLSSPRKKRCRDTYRNLISSTVMKRVA